MLDSCWGRLYNSHMTDLDKRFPSHPLAMPTVERCAEAVDVRERFRALAVVLEAALPASREKSIAMTHLEDASMWAVKAVYNQ